MPHQVPGPDDVRRLERRAALSTPPARVLLKPWVTVVAEGTDAVPTTGPALVLANHTSYLDPVFIGIAAPRALVWLATDTLVRAPGVGRAYRFFGAVPKRRFHADVAALARLKRWTHAGAVVAVFPEGERSWTGTLRPFVAEMSRLARWLGVPAVLARVDNAYRHWPRWTPRPRRGRVRVRFAAADDLSDEALRAGLTADPRPDLPLRGRHLAEGIANVLFQCPSCGSDERMTERGDAVGCEACGAAWTVDTAHHLVPPAGAPLLLEEELARIPTRLAERWEGHAGPVWRAPGVTLRDGDRIAASGQLVLHPDRLAIEDGARTGWSVALPEIEDVNVEFRRRLSVRAGGRRLEAEIPTGSAWKWPWSVRWWAHRS